MVPAACIPCGCSTLPSTPPRPPRPPTCAQPANVTATAASPAPAAIRRIVSMVPSVSVDDMGRKGNQDAERERRELLPPGRSAVLALELGILAIERRGLADDLNDMCAYRVG